VSDKWKLSAMSQDKILITVDTEEIEFTLEESDEIEVTLKTTPDILFLGSMGIPGPPGIPGGPGPSGPQGIQGPAGTPGENWFSGSGVPSGSLAGSVVGDWYLDSTNGDFYEKTGTSTWTLRGNLKGPQGIQGIQGIQGNAGTPGEKWFTGSGAPAGALSGSIVGDWYIDTANGDYYEKTGTSTWTLRGNLKGPQGTQGIQGIQGIQGNAGTPGEKWFTGSGAPAGGLAGSIVGDWYVDSSNGDYYEKTGASAWTLRGNLKGPQGIQGIQGIQGVPGTPGENWFTGSGAPAGSLAGSVVGDWYIDSANGDYYEKTGASAWTLRGSLRGPAGAGTGDMTSTEYDAKGDLIAGTGPDAHARKAVGANGTFLKADSAQPTGINWATLTEADISTLATTLATKIDKAIVDVKGDLIVATAADIVARKAAGADGTFLKAASAQADGLLWATLTEADISTLATTLATKTDKATLTTKGDLYVATAPSTPARKAVGADGTFLKAASAQADGLQWSGIVEADVSGLVADLAAKTDKATLTTKGDLYAATAASTPARVPVGANDTLLVADSAQTPGMKWVKVGDAMVLAGSNLAKLAAVTGTPDGTKFLRDDGSWQVPSGAGGIPATIVDVKGDIIAATAADAVARVAVGANGTRLIADSAQAAGVKWDTLANDMLNTPYANEISPTALAANTDNWNPTNLATATVIRIATDATIRNLTGIVGGADGRVLILVNINTTTPINLINDNTSTAANRFMFSGTAGDILTMYPNQAARFIYDGTSSRWRLESLTALGNAIPTTPGTAAPGTSRWAAREDHVHPSEVITGGSYTPTLTQSVTVTKTVVLARYVMIGKMVFLWIGLNPTGAGTTNTAITVSLPVAAEAGAASLGAIVGTGRYNDSGVGLYMLNVRIASSTTVNFLRSDTIQTANFGQDPNFAIASGDAFQFSATYEAA
jgi:hypothetical protein